MSPRRRRGKAADFPLGDSGFFLAFRSLTCEVAMPNDAIGSTS